MTSKSTLTWSISHLGKLQPWANSTLLQCLEDLTVPTDEKAIVDATILDGAAIVNTLKPTTGKIFAAYAQDVFLPHLKKHLQQTQKWLDFIWDQYDPDSLKATARQSHGKWKRRQVEPNTSILGNWQEFEKPHDNKSELHLLGLWGPGAYPCFIA